MPSSRERPPPRLSSWAQARPFPRPTESAASAAAASDFRIVARQQPVEAIGDGPAVNIDGLPEAKKLHQTRDRKGAKNRIRSTSLVHDDGARLDFAAVAR